MAFAGIYVQLARVREHLRPFGLFGYAGLLLLVISLLFWGFWGERYGFRAEPTRWSIEIGHLLPGVASVLILFFLFDPECRGARWMSARWLRFVGLVSYEWFLFHGPVVQWFQQNSGPSHGSLLAYAWRTILPLVLTFGFSVVVYRWFSLPILNRVRDSLKPSSAVN